MTTTDDLHDIWASPHTPSPQTSAPRSRPRWPNYDELSPPTPHLHDSMGNIRERLARLEEAYRHSTDTAQILTGHQQEATHLIADRLQGVVQRVHSVDERMRAVEEWRTKALEALAQAAPVLEKHKRWEDRKLFIRGLANWASAAAILYLAASGRGQGLLDALSVLRRTLGAG